MREDDGVSRGEIRIAPMGNRNSMGNQIGKEELSEFIITDSNKSVCLSACESKGE
jgi:hypothetical protein